MSDRFRLVARVSLLTVVALAPVVARAQSVFDSVRTASGVCHIWQMQVGGSNFPEDASYRRCALDRLPVRRETPMPPPPRWGLDGTSSYLVIINADGTVDPDRTRGMTRGVDTVFYRQALETIRRWRFEPGVRGGKPVRSAFPIEIMSGSRIDTIPSRLEWEYRPGTVGDTLLGRWVREAPLPAFTQSQVDSVHVAMVRRLIRIQVILPADGRQYCVLLPRGDSAAHARATELLAHKVPALARSLAPNGCERTPGTLRLVLPRVYHTEGGRAVLHPRGDFLPSWPPGLDGDSWRAWQGRCVADVPTTRVASIEIDCGASPDYASDEMLAWRNRRPQFGVGTPYRTYKAGDSVRVTVLATTSEAYTTDTLRSVVRSLQELGEHSIRDTDLPCGGWSVHSSQEGEVYVVTGDPSSNQLYITQATTRPAPNPRGPMRCGPQEPQTSEFAAFLLGGVGENATAPITLCFSRCARTYVLDPARHTVAETAVRFRFGDLRADSRVGEYLRFRIIVEPAPRSLLPIVIVRSQNRWPTSAWLPRRVGNNAWDYTVIRTDGYVADDEIYVYLAARDN